MPDLQPVLRKKKSGYLILGIVLSIGPLCFCRIEPSPSPGGSAAGPANETEFLSYDRIRVEFSTTSDWARLELLNPRDVLAMRVISAPADSPGWATGVEFLNLNQSAESARANRRPTLIADYALALEARTRPLEFYLQKGSGNESRVRVSRIGDGEERPLGRQDHAGFDPSNPGLNPLYFSVDLAPLRDLPPLRARIGLGNGKPMRWEFHDPEGNGFGAAPGTSSRAGITLLRIQQAKSRGIDGFFLYRRGPGGDSDQNLKEMLDIAAREKFRISICFNIPSASGGNPPSEDQILDALASAAGRYGEHSAFYKVDGSPLFVVPVSNAVPLEVWGRIFASLSDRGVSAAALAMGLGRDDFDFFFDRDENRAFLYPGPEKSGQFFVRGANYYSLLLDAPVPPVWITTVQPRFKRFGREHLLIWDLRF